MLLVRVRFRFSVRFSVSISFIVRFDKFSVRVVSDFGSGLR